MPGDYFPAQQVEEAEQQRQRRDFADRSGFEAEQHVVVRQFFGDVGSGRASGQRLFYISQQRRSGNGVGGGFGVDFHLRRRGSGQRIYVCRRDEACHLHRERDQQEHPSDQCRVERVAAQTAERHFADADRYQRANDDHPDG